MKIELDAKLTTAQVAAAFCELNDDEQAQFFEEVAKIARAWDRPASLQWYALGRHMASCACSTFAGRAIIDEIHGAMHEPAEGERHE